MRSARKRRARLTWDFGSTTPMDTAGSGLSRAGANRPAAETRLGTQALAPRRLTCPLRAIGLLRMIHVTESAVQQLRSLLATQLAQAGKGLRVQVVKGGCSGMQY